MITLAKIESVGQRIGREFHPDRVLLFGSYLDGTATEDSDVDLLVIMPFEGSEIDKSVEVRLAIRPPFPTDLLVRTPESIQRRLNLGDTFVRDILQNGRLLYEADRG